MHSINLESTEYQKYLLDQRKDNNVTHLSEQIFKYMNHLEKLLPDTLHKKTLDIGCRSFDTYDWFTTYNHGADIIGIDIGEEGLEYCAKKGKPCFNHDAHFLAEAFHKESFDLVLAFHSLEHMYDMPLVLRNIYEVLKPGGYLYLAVPIPSVNEGKGHWVDIANGEEMRAACIGAGFQSPVYEETVNCKFRIANEYVALVQKGF